MFNAYANVTSSVDKFNQIKLALKDLEKMDVLVGIPQEKSSRKTTETLNNAELAYIHTNGVRTNSMRREMESDVQQHGYHTAHEMYLHTHGSPILSVPPRPIIQPAIEDDKVEISRLLGEAIKAALNGDTQEANKQLKLAGLEGQSASQDWFTSPENGWAPNSPTTINKKGSDRPLIDTGQLRKSITYVVRRKEG